VSSKEAPPAFAAPLSSISQQDASHYSLNLENIEFMEFNFFRDLGPLSRKQATFIEGNHKLQKKMLSHYIEIEPN